jgi:hypothetical protein
MKKTLKYLTQCAFSYVHFECASTEVFRYCRNSGYTSTDVMAVGCRFEVVESGAGVPKLYSASLPPGKTGPQVRRTTSVVPSTG